MNRPRQFALSTVVASLYPLLPAPLLAQVADRLEGRGRTRATTRSWRRQIWRRRNRNRTCIRPPRASSSGRLPQAALDAALADARHRSSRVFELRPACDLARLWADRGQRRNAHNLLGADLQLVHRRLQYGGPEGCEGTSGGACLRMAALRPEAIATLRLFYLVLPLNRWPRDGSDVPGARQWRG